MRCSALQRVAARRSHDKTEQRGAYRSRMTGGGVFLRAAPAGHIQPTMNERLPRSGLRYVLMRLPLGVHVVDGSGSRVYLVQPQGWIPLAFPRRRVEVVHCGRAKQHATKWITLELHQPLLQQERSDLQFMEQRSSSEQTSYSRKASNGTLQTA